MRLGFDLVAFLYGGAVHDSVRITVKLSREEARALLKLAETECRHPREQAHKFIRDGLREPDSREVRDDAVSVN